MAANEGGGGGGGGGGGDVDASQSAPCDACIGITYYTRKMWRNRIAPSCYGIRLASSTTFAPIVEPQLESLSHVVVVGRSLIGEGAYDPADPASMPVRSMFGVRILAASTDEHEAPIDSDQWKRPIVSHLKRQQEMTRNLLDQMRWQLTPDGLASLVNLGKQVVPATIAFVKVYAHSMANFFAFDDQDH